MMARVSPSEVTTEVKSIVMMHEDSGIAEPGDNCGFQVRNVSVKSIRRGMVVGDAKNDPPAPVACFQAYIVVLDGHPNRIMAGYTPIIACHTALFPCRFDRLETRFNPRNGSVLEQRPRFLFAGQVGLVHMIPKRPVSVEAFSLYPALGRFLVYDQRKIVAVGMIRHTFRQHPPGSSLLLLTQSGGTLHGRTITLATLQDRRKQALLEILSPTHLLLDLAKMVASYTHETSLSLLDLSDP